MRYEFQLSIQVAVIAVCLAALCGGWPTTRWSVRGLRLAVIVLAALAGSLGFALYSGLVEHPGRELVMGLMLMGTGLLLGWYFGRTERPEPETCKMCQGPLDSQWPRGFCSSCRRDLVEQYSQMPSCMIDDYTRDLRPFMEPPIVRGDDLVEVPIDRSRTTDYSPRCSVTWEQIQHSWREVPIANTETNSEEPV